MPSQTGPGCCPACRGTGAGDANGPCWDCRGTGCAHPDPCDATTALVQVGWMLSPDLAAEFGITPLSDEYLITLEQAEQDGGIKDEYADRVIPIYRKSPSTAPANQNITTGEVADRA